MVRKFWLSVFLLLAVVVLSFPAAPARADGIIIPEPPFPGPFPIQQLNIRYHRVQVQIEDQVAITRVDQVFHNPNTFVIEGEYVFPLPKDAVVTNFKLWIDGEPVEGEILSAEEARRMYEEIVRKMVDPALLEYAGHGAVRARIFPIQPGEERQVELEYTQVLLAENGLVRYSYPLNTEKFSRQPLEQVSVSVDVRSTSDPIRAVYSPSHPVGISRDGAFRVTAGYEDKNVTPDKDFVLVYSVGEGEALHLLTYRDPNDPADPDGFYLLLLAPRPDIQPRVVPKDVIVVLDRSGSMDGEKFRQAQAALTFILERLNPEDHFNLITFSTGVDLYAQRLQMASEAQEAIQWVQQARAAGSTNIHLALLEAVALANTERPTFIIFLTDGLATEGVIDSDQIINAFSREASDNIRLFTFGVGYDVDTYLLDSLAQAHLGASTYVTPGEKIDEIVSGFYEKVSTPVLTDLSLDFGSANVFERYPDPLPDLFVGSQIVAVGRYRGEWSGAIALTGVVDGQPQTFTFPNQVLPAESLGEIQSAIPRLWATRKIGYLLNQVRLNGPDEETIDQIVRLSIRYGIVTPYTSYLVTEPEALSTSEQERIARESFSNQAAAPAAPSSGQEAVEKAQAQSSLAGADVSAAPPEEFASQLKVIGARTYLLVNGVWTDTGFDLETMQTIKVAFLSDDYFTLLSAYPALAAPFALGERVIAFAGGTAYESVSTDSPVEPIQIDPTPTPTTVPLPTQPGSTPVEPAPGQPTPSPDPSGPLACLGGLLVILLLPLAFWLRRLLIAAG